MHFLTLATLFSITLASPGLDYGRLPSLRAAVKRSDLEKRATTIETKTSATFRYVDDQRADGTTFYSDVRVDSAVSMLILEEYDHLFHRIECSTSTMVLHFSGGEAFELTKMLANELSGGLVVTSHAECGDHHSRSLFRIDSAEVHEDVSKMTFQGQPVEWEDAFSSMQFQHGQTQDEHQTRLRARQNAVSSPPKIPSLKNNYTALAPIEKLPNRTYQYLELTRPPAIDTTFPMLSDILDLPIAAGCRSCSVTGSLNLTTSNFALAKPSNVLKDGTKVVSSAMEKLLNQKGGKALRAQNDTLVLGTGEVSLDMSSFSTKVELWVEPASNGELVHTLAQYPLMGYALPKIGRVGVNFVPELRLNWAIRGGLRMSYGFEIQVPDSTIVVDVANNSRSSISGFEGATTTPLPFQANITDLFVELFFTVRPRISAGILIGDGETFTAEAGIFLDAPALNVTISQISSSEYDSNCEPRTAGTELPEADQAVLSEFPDLTHIVGIAQTGAGADIGFEIDLPGTVADRSFNPEISLASVEAQIATACLVWRDAPSAAPQVFGTSTAPAPTATYAAASEVVAATSSAIAASIAAASARATATGAGVQSAELPRWAGGSAVAAVAAIAAAMVML